jgi:hypothetical protein
MLETSNLINLKPDFQRQRKLGAILETASMYKSGPRWGLLRTNKTVKNKVSVFLQAGNL